MLASDGGICPGATGRMQANHMSFQSWSCHFIVGYKVNMEQRLQCWGWEVLQHSLYSSDPSPYDYNLVLRLKRTVCGTDYHVS